LHKHKQKSIFLPPSVEATPSTHTNVPSEVVSFNPIHTSAEKMIKSTRILQKNIKRAENQHISNVTASQNVFRAFLALKNFTAKTQLQSYIY